MNIGKGQEYWKKARILVKWWSSPYKAIVISICMPCIDAILKMKLKF